MPKVERTEHGRKLISHRVTEKTISFVSKPKKTSSSSVALATRRGAGVRLVFFVLSNFRAFVIGFALELDSDFIMKELRI